ncbi:spermine synthase [Danaus plexippus plexippus]|uniref:Spermine synthase n=1 Tax=Danaus plexippus plexippus TaxID=278856 RepID=A0A212EVV6_DANPL|nr:spermine synthase [Danaus plexippus plexippus]
MSVQTILLDFSLDPARLGDESGQKTVFSHLETVLKDYVPNLILAADIKIDDGSLKLLTGKRGTTVSVRLFDRGLVTVNIEYYKEDSEEPLINFKNTKLLENSVKISLECERIKLMPTIKRGYKYDSTKLLESQLQKYITVIKSQPYPSIKRCLFSKYYTTSDERLLEYDIDGVVFDERSPFQRVQVVHSRTFGNMLVLDDLQNISEADLIYTETLMQRGKESYEGKEIIILGGGDGALLYELLKENPKYVWMLEIDEVVMKACNKHLRSICGDVLERRQGRNYEIIVEDCMVTIDKLCSQNRKVDFVFGDLTDIPISESPGGELWEFMINILDAAFRVLKPTGKFMTHGNGATSPASLELYERVLNDMQPKVAFQKCKAFVPSFLEDWIFYQIGFHDQK